nr:helix-turn-helix transcriptional regulator [uncultured Moellerella sp.]
MKINDETLRRDIGEFLREARIFKSLTGAEFGALLGISQQQVSRYETGVCGVNIDMLNDMLNVLDKTWDDFLKIVVNRNNNVDNPGCLNENKDNSVSSCFFQ